MFSRNNTQQEIKVKYIKICRLFIILSAQLGEVKRKCAARTYWCHHARWYQYRTTNVYAVLYIHWNWNSILQLIFELWNPISAIHCLSGFDYILCFNALPTYVARYLCNKLNWNYTLTENKLSTNFQYSELQQSLRNLLPFQLMSLLWILQVIKLDASKKKERN